jgi:hypothetical protein
MGDSIDSVVKSWLVDPQWQKVFKHTFDVFQVGNCEMLSDQAVQGL